MAGIQLALNRCRGRLSGNRNKDIHVHNDMALWGSMASDMAYAMGLLRGDATPTQLAREAKELAMPVAAIPDYARPIIPAGMGDIRGPVAEALAELPETQREVYLLVVGRGMGVTEAAATLGMSRQTARVHLVRAKTRLEGRRQL